ncbi:MAG: PQQ-binding-like beta-propeller repeat protein, partial [Vicinamibacterales bacterium]
MKRSVLFFIALLAVTDSGQAQWPQFRGPDGLGTSPSHPPLTWSEQQNVRWKTAIHGRAWSSPVVLGDQVWVTTATEDGRELFAVALDRESGKILHDLKLFQVAQPQYAHPFNTYASPTPVIEPGRVYVTFGSPGTAAIDTRSGKVLWERRDLECNHFRGAGSSPILFGDLLLMHFDGSDRQYVIALDKHTGKTAWRTDRSIDFKDLQADGRPQADGDFRKAFATPHVVMVGGEPVLVSIGSKATYGYDPRTGKELWRIEERSSHSGSTRPVTGHGLVFYPTGFATGQLLAVRPDGRGDVTGTHVVWRVTRGVPNKPSPLLVGELLFMINDGGIVSCLDARTGAEVWKARLDGSYSASPVVAGGRVYF